MIALSDTDIHSWNEKINNMESESSGTRFEIIPRYTNTSAYPTIAVNKLEIFSWQPKLQTKQSIEDYSTEYSYTFSLTKEKDKKFSELLAKLRKEKILNKAIINDQAFDIILERPVIQTKEEHNVNDNTYIRNNFKYKAIVPYVIIEFYLIEKALEFVLKESKFKVNDIVSLSKDRSKDYLITHQHFNGETITAIEIKEITDEFITYGDEIQLNTKDITWSRTNRIDGIIND